MVEWIRVSKRHRCPICDHADWCLISADGTAAICPRFESDRLVGDAGWLHHLDGADDRPRPQRRIALRHRRMPPPADLAALARRFQAAAEKLGKLAEIADDLGLKMRSLARYGVGWSFRESCSTWPMCDARGRLIGINRRFKNGRKKVMPGHRAGLYMPADLPEDMSRLGRTLLVCEGASDAVAGLDLGFWTVGRFSCTHGSKLLVNLVRHRRPSLVVIVRDADGPGRRGADSLASTLLPYAPCLKLITPLAPYKDLRAWRLAGAEIADVDRLIKSATPRRLSVKVRSA